MCVVYICEHCLPILRQEKEGAEDEHEYRASTSVLFMNLVFFKRSREEAKKKMKIKKNTEEKRKLNHSHLTHSSHTKLKSKRKTIFICTLLILAEPAHIHTAFTGVSHTDDVRSYIIYVRQERCIICSNPCKHRNENAFCIQISIRRATLLARYTIHRQPIPWIFF